MKAIAKKSCLLTMLLLGTWTGGGLQAAGDVFYCFDDTADSLHLRDEGGEGIDLAYLGQSAQSAEAMKFGSGSLALGENPLMGFSGSLTEPPYSSLGEEISCMTITLWVKPRADQSDDATAFFLQRLNGSTGGGHFTFRYIPTQLRFDTEGAEGNTTNATVYSEPIPSLVEANEWTHVAMTFDHGEVVFYLNGQPWGSSQKLPDGVSSIRDITDSNAGIFRGMISSPGIQYADDIGFFGTEALSPEAIQSIYEKGLKAYLATRTSP